jgi:membrane-bound lytic murein transglycosylase C
VKKIYTILLLISINAFAISYEDFMKDQMSQYNNYTSNIEKEFDNYQKVFFEELKKYDSKILAKWPKPEKSTNHKWVQYNKDFSSKKVVDYENSNINLEVIAKDENEARNKIEKIFNDLLSDDVNRAYRNDKLQQAINKKIKNRPKRVKNNQKLVSDLIPKKTRIDYRNKIKKGKIVKKKYNGKTIYKVDLKLPKGSIGKKAKLYLKDVQRFSKKENIPMDLIYAIMHCESSFNPMAKSYIPAYGLMQIVPRSAGIDASFHVYGKKKVLSSSYLYNPNNNIKMGTAYLHILYYKYLKKINDPLSRLYCTIAAYNTGAGNVAKAFIGKTNIKQAAKKINKMTSNEVYNTLIKRLPYLETRKYLLKVNKKKQMYAKMFY